MLLGSETPEARYRRFVAATLARRIPLIVRNAGAGFDAEAVARLETLARTIEADAPMELDLSGWPFTG